jgi:hypothetical protein
MKGRSQRTYNLKVNKIKKWYNHISKTTKKKLKPLNYYIDNIKQPNSGKD